MEKLSEVECAVIKHFNIKPTTIKAAEGDEWMPSLAEVATFCMHNDYSYAVYNKITAWLLLDGLAEKLRLLEDDCV